MKKISVDLDATLHHKIKVYCAESGFSIQNFVLRAITVALAPKDGSSLGEKAVVELTTSEKRKILIQGEKMFKIDDPLAIDLLRAFTAFYDAHLPRAQALDGSQG